MIKSIFKKTDFTKLHEGCRYFFNKIFFNNMIPLVILPYKSIKGKL